MNTITYTIEIDGTTALVVSPNDGFIDDKPVWLLDSFDTNTQEAGTTIPTNLEKGLGKARGYARWQQLLKDLGAYTSISISNVNYSDGAEPTLDAAPEKIAFDITFDNFDNVKLEDEFNEGTILVDEDAIKRIIAMSLDTDRTRTTFDIYDSTITESNNPQGITINPLTVGRCLTIDPDKETRYTAIEELITVTEVV